MNALTLAIKPYARLPDGWEVKPPTEEIEYWRILAGKELVGVAETRIQAYVRAAEIIEIRRKKVKEFWGDM